MSLLQCSCTGNECNHSGACQQAATMALSLNRKQQEYCAACYQTAQATNPEHITKAVGLL